MRDLGKLTNMKTLNQNMNNISLLKLNYIKYECYCAAPLAKFVE